MPAPQYWRRFASKPSEGSLKLKRMDHRAPSNLFPTSLSQKLFCAFLALCLVLPAAAGAALQQPNSGLRLELPANGNIRVEHFRGSGIAQVWKENYVSVAAVADSGEGRSLPAVIDLAEGLLSIRLARAAKGAARINLELSVP